MNFSTFKKWAVTSAVALTLFSGAQSYAQETTTIGATISTAAALSVAAGNDLDLGTWALVEDTADAANTATFQVEAVSGTPSVPTCSGWTDPSSVCENTVAPAQSGSIDVTAPVATDLVIFGDVTTDFTGSSNISLGSLIYSDTVATNATLPTSAGTAVATITAGGAAETIYFGGTVSVTGTAPESQTYSGAVIEVTFQY